MEIAGFQRVSLIDYPGRMATLLFVTGCNMRCPFCHNADLVLKNYKKLTVYPEQEVLQKLKESKAFVDAVQISGGEPTLWSDLPQFIRKCKKLGFSVKLDTNGTNPAMVEKLLKEKQLDYVAMDIKAPLNNERYSKSIGVKSDALLEKINQTIDLLLNSKIDYEFRTTLVPGLVSVSDVMDIAVRIRNANAYYLQQFKSANTLDPALRRVEPYWNEVLYELREKIVKQNLVKKCEVRA